MSILKWLLAMQSCMLFAAVKYMNEWQYVSHEDNDDDDVAIILHPSQVFIAV